MFENAGEIVILVLAVIVTWVVARASAEGHRPADRTVLSGLRAAVYEARSTPGSTEPRGAFPVLPAGTEPEYDLIRVIDRADIARSA